MTTVIALREATLPQLASQANLLHREYESAALTTVSLAMRCGELLTEAKDRVAHGEWLPWLAEHFDGSERTARGYMQLASAPEANRQRIADMTLSAALRAVVDPARAKPDANSPEGKMLANASILDDDIVDAEVVEAPDDPRWERITASITAGTVAMREANADHLTPVSTAETLRQASREFRLAATALEDLAQTYERQTT